MKKLLLFMAAACLSIPVCSAQYLYGTSVAAGTQASLVRFNPANNSFVTILKFFNYYQPVSTKDTLNKVIYFMTPNPGSASQNPDTLITFKVADSSMSKRPFAKGTFPYPQYYNGRLISVSPSGMAAFDLATNQFSLIDTNVKINGIHSADFDRTRGRYISMKRSSNSTFPDTIFVYTLATRVLNKYPLATIAGNSNEMCYSPTSDKALFLGAQTNTGNLGIYSFNLATQQVVFEMPLANTGTLVNCSTFDEVNNRYFCVKTTNNIGTGFNILEYKLNTSTAVDHLVGPPGLGFPQYFDNQHFPQTGTGIGNLAEEEPFKMYPNPAGNLLHLNIELSGQKTSIRILDLTGKVVLEKAIAEAKNTIDVSTLAPGKYVLTLIFKDKTYTRLFDKSE